MRLVPNQCVSFGAKSITTPYHSTAAQICLLTYFAYNIDSTVLTTECTVPLVLKMFRSQLLPHCRMAVKH